MLSSKLADISESSEGGVIWTQTRRNHIIFARHPTLKHVKEEVKKTLLDTYGIGRVLRSMDERKDTEIISILEDISQLDFGHLLVPYIPLLEQIYRFEGKGSLGWMNEYSHILNGGRWPDMNGEQLMALVRMKQTIQAKVIHGGESMGNPADFVDTHLQGHIYDVSPFQLTGIFLVLELIRRRISYIKDLLSKHGNDPKNSFSEVAQITFKEQSPLKEVTQQGPFLEFIMTRKAMDTMSSKRDHGLFYYATRNKSLLHAYALTENYHTATQRHEQHHHTSVWTSLEQVLGGVESFYFGTKDEITAFMAELDSNRTFHSIFEILFTSPSYDPHIKFLNDKKHKNLNTYHSLREEYRQILLVGLIYARLLEKKIGRKDAVDVLTFIHFRSWGLHLRKIFDIKIPPSINLMAIIPGREKEIFASI